MSTSKYIVCICLSLVLLSGVAQADWKRSGAEKKQEIKVPVHWNGLPIIFEGFPGWWKTKQGKRYVNSELRKQILLLDEANPQYFTFSKRYNKVEIMTWGEYYNKIAGPTLGRARRGPRKKVILRKTGGEYLISLFGKECTSPVSIGKCAYIRLGEYRGKKYVIFRFIHNDIQGRKLTWYSEWMTDGVVNIADNWCYLYARNAQGNEKHEKALAAYRDKENKKRAEKARKEAERRRLWQEKQDEQRRSKAELRRRLLSGELTVKDANDYSLIKDASSDESYQYGPPSDGPSLKTEYFDWEGRRIKKMGDYYISWDPRRRSGFAFTKIKQVNGGRIMENGIARVVGEYGHNIKITLVSGESVMIPVLVNVYIYAY